MSPRDRRRGRWLGVGLVLSLALNAFFIGAAATDMIRFDKDGDGHKHGGAAALRIALAWRRACRPMPWPRSRRRSPPGGPMRGATSRGCMQLRAELGDLLAAQTPDRAAIDAKLAAIRSELDAMLGSAQAATINSLLTLPPDTRKALAGG